MLQLLINYPNFRGPPTSVHTKKKLVLVKIKFKNYSSQIDKQDKKSLVK